MSTNIAVLGMTPHDITDYCETVLKLTRVDGFFYIGRLRVIGLWPYEEDEGRRVRGYQFAGSIYTDEWRSRPKDKGMRNLEYHVDNRISFRRSL